MAALVGVPGQANLTYVQSREHISCRFGNNIRAAAGVTSSGALPVVVPARDTGRLGKWHAQWLVTRVTRRWGI